MEYTSDSDVSEDTRDLVRQGLASVKRKRVTIALQPERLRERLSVPNMAISSIRHPLWQDGSIGAISTHGLNPADREFINGQNHNNVSIDVVYSLIDLIVLFTHTVESIGRLIQCFLRSHLKAQLFSHLDRA